MGWMLKSQQKKLCFLNLKKIVLNWCLGLFLDSDILPTEKCKNLQTFGRKEKVIVMTSKDLFIKIRTRTVVKLLLTLYEFL